MINPKCTKPCGNCPFRRSVEFPLGAERRSGIAESLSNDFHNFPCHKTKFAPSGAPLPDSAERHCVGALMVLEQIGRPNILMRLARADGLYHPDNLEGWGDVYEDFEDFVESAPDFDFDDPMFDGLEEDEEDCE